MTWKIFHCLTSHITSTQSHYDQAFFVYNNERKGKGAF